MSRSTASVVLAAGMTVLTASMYLQAQSPGRPTLSGSAAPGQAAGRPTLSGSAAPGQAAAQQTLQRYCISCHNERLKTGSLALDGVDLQNIGAHSQVWEKVVTKLRTAAMPPVGRPRPDAATYDAVASWLEGELDRAAASTPNPGVRPPLHRLN